MTMDALLTRTQGGARWDDIPDLATCSFFEYQPEMGTPVRISRGAPRGMAVPGGEPHWPVVRALFPSPDILHKGLSVEEFADRYCSGLDQTAGLVDAGLRVIRPDRRMVLLCFENRRQLAANPLCCHRRVFARWWEARTGREVPELT